MNPWQKVRNKVILASITIVILTYVMVVVVRAQYTVLPIPKKVDVQSIPILPGPPLQLRDTIPQYVPTNTRVFLSHNNACMIDGAKIAGMTYNIDNIQVYTAGGMITIYYGKQGSDLQHSDWVKLSAIIRGL